MFYLQFSIILPEHDPTNQLHLMLECHTLPIVFSGDPTNVQLDLNLVIVVATQEQ
jgi:hypothetical protein